MNTRDKQRWYDRWVAAWYCLRGWSVIANLKITTLGMQVESLDPKQKCYSLNVTIHQITPVQAMTAEDIDRIQKAGNN